MKFKIISSIIILVIVVAALLIGHKSVQLDENGNPVEQVQQDQPQQ